ncbi:SIMPL domain-containing protein [Marivita hallyeonensis]|uniref:26 kDa periplasmic immunogenic protein n=1 Tax=Marivita hallyeonensis TaxID=996342 RepID=A0A1M5VMI9_9RHOB|nr:SIMPL domain-containing protein [Marivita hallyeonensis]SHH76437.1 hypothetical protein SAMN05443551_2955 [Marivita hallyeonensis]
MQWVHGLLTTFVLILSVSASAAQTEGRLTVTGEGRVAAVPDMAVITMGATSQAETAQDAMAQTSDITAAILTRLTEFGIEPRDVQTSDLSLSPVWRNRGGNDGSPQIDGYQASNRVTARVRDLDRLGEILDAALSDGANRLGGLHFTLSDPDPLTDDARRLAVANARAKAELFAEAAGVELGALISLSEAGVAMPQPEMLGMARAADAGVPIAQGETELRASVTLVYEISTP